MTLASASPCKSALPIWTAHNHAPIVTRIAIAGDFLPTGNVHVDPDSSWTDAANPISSHFVDIDASFLNLECPIDVDELEPTPLNGIGQIVSARPDVLSYLQTIRCPATGIANNHAYDFGPDGVLRTRAALTREKITALGAGYSLQRAPEVFVWQAPQGPRVGFWACASAARNLARRNKTGVEPASAIRASQAIAAMKRRGANFFVALVHAGSIRASRPSPEDVTLLRDVASIGFHIIAASHSHRIAGTETLTHNGTDPSFCFYGLGSLVSGYVGSVIEREGLIVVAGFTAHGALASIEVRPVYLRADGLGEVPSHDVAQDVLARFEFLSREIADGSYRQRFYDEVSPGIVRLYSRDVRTAYRQSGLRGIARKTRRLRLRHVKRLVHRVFRP